MGLFYVWNSLYYMGLFYVLLLMGLFYVWSSLYYMGLFYVHVLLWVHLMYMYTDYCGSYSCTLRFWTYPGSFGLFFLIWMNMKHFCLSSALEFSMNLFFVKSMSTGATGAGPADPVSQRIRSPRKSIPGQIRFASDFDSTLADLGSSHFLAICHSI